MTDNEAPAYVPAIGDVFYRSWGYDQSNINYYRVIGVTASGKSVNLVEVGHAVEDDGVVPTSRVYGECATCEQFITERDGKVTHTRRDHPVECDPEFYPAGSVAAPKVYSKRLPKNSRRSTYGVTLAFNSYSSLYLWTGKPMYDTIALGGVGH